MQAAQPNKAASRSRETFLVLLIVSIYVLSFVAIVLGTIASTFDDAKDVLELVTSFDVLKRSALFAIAYPIPLASLLILCLNAVSNYGFVVPFQTTLVSLFVTILFLIQLTDRPYVALVFRTLYGREPSKDFDMNLFTINVCTFLYARFAEWLYRLCQ